jgi:hypothetical protein
MTDPKVKLALEAALNAFSKYGTFEATPFLSIFEGIFASETDFMSKIALVDEVFDDYPKLEALREVFFDLLLVNFFSADVQKLEADYLDSPEWEDIEEQTLDRGTELLNLLLYLNECRDEDIEPSLDDYLKEFLLVDEDEFQDEYRIYEPVIANQALLEGPISGIRSAAENLPDDSELTEIFYPMMCFFQNISPSADEKAAIATAAINQDFDMAVLEILTCFAD